MSAWGFLWAIMSTQEILMGPEQELKVLFRDSNMNAYDIM